MEQWQNCRTCLAVLNLNPIFAIPNHHEKYSQVVLEATGVKININDCLPKQMCSPCINFINEIYRFRKKCEETQKTLSERLNENEVLIEGVFLQTDKQHFIDINDLIEDFQYDEVTLNEYNLELDESQDESPKETIKNHIKVKAKEKKTVKRTLRARKSDKEKEKGREKDQEREKQEIECEYCHKILTSKLSLRNHYKIHTGFDVVCEHCGKKFITRRLLLMHCKAKHGYEKTDKCSFCEYRASNAEQVKIHERLHTGEKPYVCATCGSGFHRKSSYLQHVAIHLPEKTVQCTQCPARFKSVTLMRIHANRHRAAQYTYKCLVCAHNFARRRNVARHLVRIHAVQPRPEHIERSKCA